MANDWTRLLQEASKRNGPDGLRAFYASQGRREGIGGTVLVLAGVALLAKAARSFAKAKAVDTATEPDAKVNKTKATKRPAASTDPSEPPRDGTATPDEGTPGTADGTE